MRGLLGLSIATVVTLIAGFALVFFYAPLDADQGFVQKIFYLHVPLATMALLGFIIAGVQGIQHLRTGDAILGLDVQAPEGAFVRHAGTARKDGKVVTSGGRVLCVGGRGATLEEAASRAYAEKSRGARPIARCTPSVRQALRPSKTSAKRYVYSDTTSSGSPYSPSVAAYCSIATGT